jgi:2'-5' RNA ligase
MILELLEKLQAMQEGFGGHNFSCAMLYVPKEQAKVLKQYQLEIAEEDVFAPEGAEAKYGLEKELHVTALYGIHTDDPKQVEQVVAGFGPVKFKTGDIEMFPDKEDKEFPGQKYDVLYICIDGEDCHKLNAKLKELEYTQTQPSYIPHMTLAYVKAGKGQKYTRRVELKDQVAVECDAIEFSDTKDKYTTVSLTKDK